MYPFKRTTWVWVVVTLCSCSSLTANPNNHFSAFDCGESASQQDGTSTNTPIPAQEAYNSDSGPSGVWVTEVYNVQVGCATGQCRIEQRTRRVWRPLRNAVNRVATRVAEVTEPVYRTEYFRTFDVPVVTSVRTVVQNPIVYSSSCGCANCTCGMGVQAYADPCANWVPAVSSQTYVTPQRQRWRLFPRLGQRVRSWGGGYVYQPPGQSLSWHLRNEHGIDTTGMSRQQMLALHTSLH